ncbi:MAG: RNA-binding protein [Lachnospiraceae bacterium]|nr:RNA-binding protein [Lachnospiraceae bacterium]
MIQLGKVQNLEVLRLTSVGAYIGEAPDPLAVFSKQASANSSSLTGITDVLLPSNEIKSPLKAGDTVRAFVYLDSEDRPIASLKEPALTIGSIASLEVSDVNRNGAFLEWGFPKQLFLPFKEQTAKPVPGDHVLVTLYVDRSKRLCATMRLYKCLRLDSEYKASDRVRGTVYEIDGRHGAYIAVDNLFSGMIPTKELVRELKVGDVLSLRVSRVLEDGKLELSMREPGYLQIHIDCDFIINELKKAPGGFLPYNDASGAATVKERFKISKNSFKRAIGHLMKENKIEITEKGIRLILKQ